MYPILRLEVSLSVTSTMFLGYVHKDLVVCYLVLFFVNYAAAEISLDYYFGNEEPLRSSSEIGDCGSEVMAYYCYEKCGSKHACLLGQCFCVAQDNLTEESSNEELISEEGEEISIEGRSSESYETDRNYLNRLLLPIIEYSKKIDEESETRPALRHHIAHFCPNLDIARACIRKCMEVNMPAFCGKDHFCYCGHHYAFSGKDPEPSVTHSPFSDLYEKYFGPQN